jgi:hypothetical protein
LPGKGYTIAKQRQDGSERAVTFFTRDAGEQK